MPPSRLTLLATLLALGGAPASADILDLSAHRWSFVAEAGLQWQSQMDIHGYRQSNATDGWDTPAPAIRAEAWLARSDALNLGVVIQPQALAYRDILSSRLDYRGNVFLPGQAAALRYDYGSLRFTANYPLWAEGGSASLRAGASLLLRYVDLELSTPTARLRSSDLVVAPLLNLEGGVRLNEDFSVVARADLFPALRGAGFYDIFAGLRHAAGGDRAFEFGARIFLGGYLPEQANEFGNRVLWQSVVARFVF